MMALQTQPNNWRDRTTAMPDLTQLVIYPCQNT